MSGYPLDTNIPSELTRQKSASQVERWLNDADFAGPVVAILNPWDSS